MACPSTVYGTLPRTEQVFSEATACQKGNSHIFSQAYNEREAILRQPRVSLWARVGKAGTREWRSLCARTVSGGCESHSLMTQHNRPLRWVWFPFYGRENSSACCRVVSQFLKTYVMNKLSPSMFCVPTSQDFAMLHFTVYGLL